MDRELVTCPSENCSLDSHGTYLQQFRQELGMQTALLSAALSVHVAKLLSGRMLWRCLRRASLKRCLDWLMSQAGLLEHVPKASRML